MNEFIFIMIGTLLFVDQSNAQTKKTKQPVPKSSSVVSNNTSYDLKKLNSRDSSAIDSLSKLATSIARNRVAVDSLYVSSKNRSFHVVVADSSSSNNKPTIKTRLGFRRINVSFATDRNLIKSKSRFENVFGTDRAEVSYGNCTVTIPDIHTIGELESPSLLNVVGEDKTTHVVLETTQRQSEKEFFLQLAKRINSNSDKKAFIFIHGYNVSFEDAAKRTAQICYDLKFTGVPTFYSWPSQDSFYKYPTDETNIDWTVEHLEKFLKDFFSRTNAENVYIIAHSLGNRAMSQAIASVAKSEPEAKAKIKELILAAPDVDAEIFKNRIAPALKKVCKRITIYGASTDLAITFSKLFHTYKRLGESYHESFTMPGIDFIDATGVDTSILGHSYLATTRTILTDISAIINNIPESRRFGLRPVPISANPVLYYQFRK